jgi:hypothetical protein
MRQQAIEMIAGQGREQFIVQGQTGLRNGYLHCDIPPGRSGRLPQGWVGRSERAVRGKTHYRKKQAALSVR